MSKEKVFGSDFKLLLENFSFTSPQFAKLNEDFSNVLGGSENLSRYQTIGGLDTVYIPPERKNVETEESFLSKLEEQFHIEQLRRNSVGWFLEAHCREFAQVARGSIKQILGGKSLGKICNAFIDYKSYCESLRLPLEFQARVRFMLYFNISEYIFGPKYALSYFLDSPAGLGKAEETLPHLCSYRRYHKHNAKSFCEDWELDIKKLANFSCPDYYPLAIVSWIEKVTQVCKSLSTKIKSTGKKCKLLLFLKTDLLELPAWIALNPTSMKNGRYLNKEEALQSDPRTRFFQSSFALATLSQDALENALKEALQCKYPNTYYPIKKIAIEKVCGNGIPVLRNLEKCIHRFREKVQAPSSVSRSILLPLRPIENLPPPSSTCSFASDDASPSIKIRRSGKGFIARICNDDLISEQFLKNLQLLNKGIQIINKLPSCNDLETYLKFTTKQHPILTLYHTSNSQIPLKKQREIAYALGIPNWPPGLHELAQFLSIPSKEIKKYYKSIATYLDSDMYFIPLLFDLSFLLSDFRNQDPRSTMKDLFAAFNEANLLNEDQLKEILKEDFYTPLNLILDEIVCKAIKLPNAYNWENLIEEIECMNKG